MTVSSNRYPTLNSNLSANKLYIQSGAFLSINGNTLTINGIQIHIIGSAINAKILDRIKNISQT